MRLIDGDSLHEEISKWPESVMYKDWVQSAIANAPTIAQPPNDPLPLDELKQMDGEPVWVVVPWANVLPHWMIVDVRMDCVYGVEDNYEEFSEYGQDGWIAYRRKPVSAEEASRMMDAACSVTGGTCSQYNTGPCNSRKKPEGTT